MLHWMLTRENGAPECENLVAVTVGHKVYCFEGYRSSGNRDQLFSVHVFNTVSSRWKKLPPVTPGRDGRPLEVPDFRSRSFTAVLIEDVIYVWGGSPYGHPLYAFDVGVHRWFLPNVSGTAPEGREMHSACVSRKTMYIHGGANLFTGFTNGMYKLDTTTMVWSLINTIGTPPPASLHHSATIIGTKMFVFGGSGHEDNIRVFDTETNCWLRKPPSAQLGPEGGDHSAFAYNGELYILDDNRDPDCNDLWKFNPETLSWKKVEPKGKGPSQICFKSHCLVGDRVFLFGAHLKTQFSLFKSHSVSQPGYTPIQNLYVLDLSPSLKTLCKLAVTLHGLEQSELPHDIRWELAAVTTNSNR